MKTLADRVQAFLADPWVLISADSRERRALAPNARAMRMALRSARRFTLDDDFLAEVVIAAASSPEIILRRAALALLPFENVWIELNQHVRAKLQIELGTAEQNDRWAHGRKEVVGYLIRRERGRPDVWRATGFQDITDPGYESDVVMATCSQVFDDDAEANTILPPDETTRSVMASGWGFRGLDEERRSLLLNRGCTIPETGLIWPLIQLHTDPRTNTLDARARHLWTGYERVSVETAGDMRFLVTALAMINHVPVRYEHRPATGRFTRRLNSMDYLDTHVVTIQAGRVKTKTILDRAVRQFEQSRRRAHEVRGHWMLAMHGKGGRPGCSHLPISGDGETCVCGKCGGKLVWRDHHQRGDASLGFVKKEYEVTT